MKNSNWNYLSDEYITSLLVGDTPVTYKNDIFPERSKYNSFIDIKMPELCEDQIKRLSEKVGIKDVITGDTSQSLSQLIQACNGDEQKIKEILKYIFSKENFEDLYDNPNINSLDEFKKIRSEICRNVIKEINTKLYFYDCKLMINYDGLDLIQTDENWVNELILSIPDMDNIDSFQISDSYKKISEDINKGDNTGAVTQARTLLEGTLKYAISKQNKELTGKDKLPQLFKTFKHLYLKDNISNPELRSYVEQLYGGMSGAILAIAAIRNKFGDAHAADDVEELTKENIHFIVNASLSLCDFILEVCKKK